MTKYNSRKRRNIIIITAIVCIIAFAVILYSIQNPFSGGSNQGFDTSQDFIEFTDVGQGDSAIIYSNGYCAVIDVGLPNTAAALSEDLGEYGIKTIDALIISHLHSDHIGGLPQIAERFEIENLISPEITDKSILAAKNGKDIAVKGGAKYYTAKQGMTFNIGEFEITLLSDFADKNNENNNSIFVMAEINGIKTLFTGDAETKAEKWLLKENLNIDCDILKVGHHGSNTSSSKAFLEETTPEYAVISVGEDNIYHHPHGVTLKALKSIGAKIYRTDTGGDITFNFENGEIIPIKEK